MDLQHPCVGLLQNANWWGKAKEMMILKNILKEMEDIHFYWVGEIGPYTEKILDELKEFLESKGIGSSIHYPIPIHLQPASAKFNLKEGSFPITETQAKKILTLPINQYVTENEIKYISDMVNNFFK
jgi:dTDP-4-amino-4,6-dideoxygalactose transaminase